jgi:UDP-N-acetylmuramoyl-L-alanyl-D-glutamate--2,6-diaminopimelate ligase
MSRHSCSPRTIADVVQGLSGVVNISHDNVVLTGITQDSRDVQGGDIYCCIRGEHFDGHAYAREAVESGAVALLVDAEIEGVSPDVAVIRVSDVRRFVGGFASSLFGFPSSQLMMVGVTGTNGKTTTTAMIASIAHAGGKSVRQIGTLTGARTTPEAIDLQAQLKSWVAEGVNCVVMEVSSHALVQHRIGGLVFDASVFTNIGRDHLDFHGTEEAYFAAKAMLFTEELSRCGVVNIDDPKGMLLHDAMSIPMVGFSSTNAGNVDIGIDHVSYAWNDCEIDVPMGGSFTLMNSLAAATVAKTLGFDNAAISDGLKSLSSVPGRFESVPNQLGVGVIVDYAHTPESLESLLTSVRQVCSGRVITVFGCGGNRDTGKRPLMGNIAATLSDVCFVTSDNPRQEDPQSIIDEICSGISTSSAGIFRMTDREEAIESAIREAGRDDIVVIAGKGHESTQEISGVFHPFSDVDVATKALHRREETTE